MGGCCLQLLLAANWAFPLPASPHGGSCARTLWHKQHAGLCLAGACALHGLRRSWLSCGPLQGWRAWAERRVAALPWETQVMLGLMPCHAEAHAVSC